MATTLPLQQDFGTQAEGDPGEHRRAVPCSPNLGGFWDNELVRAVSTKRFCWKLGFTLVPKLLVTKYHEPPRNKQIIICNLKNIKVLIHMAQEIFPGIWLGSIFNYTWNTVDVSQWPISVVFDTMKLMVCSVSLCKFSIPCEFSSFKSCPHGIKMHRSFSSFQREVLKFNIFWFPDIASENMPSQKERIVSRTIFFTGKLAVSFRDYVTKQKIKHHQNLPWQPTSLPRLSFSLRSSTMPLTPQRLEYCFCCFSWSSAKTCHMVGW